MSSQELWRFLPIGYLLTIALEIPVLYLGLSRHYSRSQRLLAGCWLTACTYPIVVLVLPSLMFPTTSRSAYLWVAETFAPLAECILFRLGFVGADVPARTRWRDYAVIVLANLVSFLVGGEIVELVW